MKKLLVTLLLVTTCSISLWAQQFIVKTSTDMIPGKPCDKSIVKVSYIMNFVNDTTQSPIKPINETMILEVGKKISQFYCYTSFVGDSIFSSGIKNGLSQSLINENLSKYGMGKISWRIYKNFNGPGTTTMLDTLGMERFKCEESNERPQWKLSADTATVVGYLCHKATTTYKGREWSAWYTSKIPVSDGPWKLCGLPGLILKANDSHGHYTFEANGIEKGKSEDILYKGEEYENISRKDLNKIYTRYYSDPVGYITTNPNITISLTDGNGNKAKNPKNFPYNPIER